MKVKFKHNGEMFYEVKGETDTEYDLAIIGLVPKELLVEYDESDGLIDIVDLAVELTNGKYENSGRMAS